MGKYDISKKSDCKIWHMDGFPSGQRGQTVNLLATLSVVRIHLHPFCFGKLADAYAAVAELADAQDLKSCGTYTPVPVRFRFAAVRNESKVLKNQSFTLFRTKSKIYSYGDSPMYLNVWKIDWFFVVFMCCSNVNVWVTSRIAPKRKFICRRRSIEEVGNI